jgi:diadenosine tetraphosphate (Ap4A) HIT family hydrolase
VLRTWIRRTNFLGCTIKKVILIGELGKNEMDFKLLSHEHFNVDHCRDTLVTGYLIVSPVTPVSSLAALPKEAQRNLGPILAAATAVIINVIAPIKIYYALFGEEHDQVHFHIFPRTAATTTEFLDVFPEQRDQIHGPVLLDWARSSYRAPSEDVWRSTSATISALRKEFNRLLMVN